LRFDTSGVRRGVRGGGFFFGAPEAIVGVECAAKNFFQAGFAIDARDFSLHSGNILLEQLAEVGEDGGVARRNAILRDGLKEIAEGVIEIGVGAEFAGEGGEFVAEFAGGDELLFLMGVEEAIFFVLIPAGHGAIARVGKSELAEIGGLLFGRRFFLFCGRISLHDFS
jgi:hypothetical protein